MTTLAAMQQLGQPAMSAITKELAQLPGLIQVYHDALEVPAVGSRAERLLSDELGERAIHIASTCIASALDHVSTMKRIAESRELPPYALFSLARTAHESALNAEWLMEPGLDESDQIARGVGAQYDDYCERAKAEAAMGSQRTGAGQLAVDRRATYMTKAHARGFAELNAKGVMVPTRTVLQTVDLFDKFESRTLHLADGSTVAVKGSVDYRIYSAYARGMQWANMLGLMTPIAEPNAHGHSVATVVASDVVLVRAFAGPTGAISRALFGLFTHREPRA